MNQNFTECNFKKMILLWVSVNRTPPIPDKNMLKWVLIVKN